MRITWHKTWLWLILGLGTLLRCLQLGQRDFWYDEAYTGIVVRQSFGGIISELVQDVHPPVYFFVTHVLAWPFHYSVIGIRLVSVLFGVLAIAMTYLLGKELFSRRAGLFAALFVAILPFTIQFSQEARMYTMCAFFILSAGFCFVRSLTSTRWYWPALWGVSLGLAFLTHYLSLLFLPLFGIAWVLTRSSLRELWPSRAWWLGLCIPALLFAPWYRFFQAQLATHGEKTKWITPAVFTDLFRTIQMFIVGIPKGERSAGMPFPLAVEGLSEHTVLIGVTIIALLATGLVVAKYKKATIIPLLGSWGFMLTVYVLSLQDIRYFVARYLLVAAYFLCILLGGWLAALSRRTAFIAIAGYLLLLSHVIPVGNSQGYNELAHHLSDYQGKHFYALNSFDYVIAKYYLGEERVRLYNVGWPQYDSRYWPGIGPRTQRIEDLNVLVHDPDGIILRNIELPVEQRDDRWFDPKPFTLETTYRNLEVYRPILPTS